MIHDKANLRQKKPQDDKGHHQSLKQHLKPFRLCAPDQFICAC
jgi:hypothetical protein